MWTPEDRGRVHVAPCRQRQGACGHLQIHAWCMWPPADACRVHVAISDVGKMHVTTFLTDARHTRPPTDGGVWPPADKGGVHVAS
jgi:hypothetical protein